jgi:RNA polymerase sigma factor (sigma-70 family)
MTIIAMDDSIRAFVKSSPERQGVDLLVIPLAVDKGFRTTRNKQLFEWMEELYQTAQGLGVDFSASKAPEEGSAPKNRKRPTRYEIIRGYISDNLHSPHIEDLKSILDDLDKARNALCKLNEPLILYWVKKKLTQLNVANRSNLSDDLRSSGNLALIKAIDRFDLGREVKFVTVASRWIKHAFADYFERSSKIRDRPYGSSGDEYELVANIPSREPASGQVKIDILDCVRRLRNLLKTKVTNPKRLELMEKLIERCIMGDEEVTTVGAELGLEKSWAHLLLNSAMNHLKQLAKANGLA